MRIANHDDRAVFIVGDKGDERAVDIWSASSGRFGPALGDIYRDWDELRSWVDAVDVIALAADAFPVDRAKLGPPSPQPRQVFAVGLNYHAHAAESGFDSPTDLPPVFTKYVSSFSGPDTEVVIPSGGNVDWEVELVVIIGRQASRIDADLGWSHVAGLTVGQDLSERISQLRGPAPQFGLGKSFAGFAPQGPWLVSPDEFDNPDDLELGCSLDGEEVQKGRTRDMIFPVPQLLAGLAQTVTLYPGDIVFTGTPSGVGVGREQPRFIAAGQQLDSWIEGIGELHQAFVTDPYSR